MCRAVARAMASPQYSATTNNAMSIPAEIPAEVMTFPAFTTWDFESTVTFGKSSCIVCRVRQWVVARRPSSNPAFPRINAPATDPGPATGMQSRVSLHSLIGPRHPAKIAKTKNRKEKRTNNSVTRRRVLLQRTTRKQGDNQSELGISVGGDREPPREHIVWVVFGFQTL